jgi:oxygen-independent coproporphyrinogen-3 oxidase
MSGIYIHIPFCRKRCSYCDFYTEVAPNLIPSLIEAIIKELHIRRNYLNKAPINTIYVGGGTPSILDYKAFSTIFNAINELFKVDKNAEITFEANPDDLSENYLQMMASLPFNRISIGIQSFDDEDLLRINRRHSGNEAIQAVANAQKVGFNNISIDLIYGLPYQTPESWEKQLQTALNMNIQHISAYGLTYEEGTALWKQKENGTIVPSNDKTMNAMYEKLLELTKKNDFEAYEISNFALAGYRSRHNTSYWKQQPYLGIGPSAHSYNLYSRQWNISSITQYIKAINNGIPFYEREELSLETKYNDYVMVSLRTSDGIDLNLLTELFGVELKEYCLKNIQPFIESNKVKHNEHILSLTASGIEISNLIIIEIMKV